MNTTQLDFHAHSQNDALAGIFSACPGEWFSMVDLGERIGAWAVHSRVSDLRKKGFNIENKREWVTSFGRRKCISFYRLNT